MNFVYDPPIPVKIRKMQERVRWNHPEAIARKLDPTRLAIADDGTKDEAFSFWVMGDSGTGRHRAGSPQRRVAEAMWRRGEGCRFALHVGDVVYLVGSSEQYFENFIVPYRRWLVGGDREPLTPDAIPYDRMTFSTPIFPVLGNHDYYDLPAVYECVAHWIPRLRRWLRSRFDADLGRHGSHQGEAYARAFLDYLADLPEAELGEHFDRYYTAETDTGRALNYRPGEFTRLPNRYYRFRYGGIDFFALDSNTFNAPEALPQSAEGAQQRRQLQARRAVLEAQRREVETRAEGVARSRQIAANSPSVPEEDSTSASSPDIEVSGTDAPGSDAVESGSGNFPEEYSARSPVKLPHESPIKSPGESPIKSPADRPSKSPSESPVKSPGDLPKQSQATGEKSAARDRPDSDFGSDSGSNSKSNSDSARDRELDRERTAPRSPEIPCDLEELELDELEAELEQIEEEIRDIDKQLAASLWAVSADLEQLDWLQQGLIDSWRSPEARGRVLYFHHPPYVTETSKWKQSQTLAVRQQLRRVLDGVRATLAADRGVAPEALTRDRPVVDLAIGGHAHCLEYLETGDTGHADSHLPWLICGGSGYSLRRQRSEGDDLYEALDGGNAARPVARSKLFVGRSGRGTQGRSPYSFLRIDVDPGTPPKFRVQPVLVEREGGNWRDRALEPLAIGG